MGAWNPQIGTGDRFGLLVSACGGCNFRRSVSAEWVENEHPYQEHCDPFSMALATGM